MPTGYTVGIKNGITFKKFALDCARAFGACITMRDDSMDAEIPDEFLPSDYHQKAVEIAKTNLAEAKILTLKDAEIKAQEEYKENVNRREELLRENRELKDKYMAMLYEVRRWQPPTPDHVELKNFMVAQIQETIDFDCNTSYMIPLKCKTPEQWLEDHTNRCQRDVDYHSKGWAAEVERCKSRAEWIRALRASLI